MKNVSVISGSSRGIGMAVAARLIANGDRVYINARSANEVAATVDRLGPEARPWVADLTDEKSVQEGLAKIAEREGRIDRIVSNIGSGKADASANISISEFRQMFEINFFQAVYLCQHALPYMKTGDIIFVASIAGVESIGAPMPYNAAKAALLSYMKSLSDRVASRGIRVNAISPGNVFFPGGRWEEKLAADRASVEKMLRDQVPLQKFVEPNDIAEAVDFILRAPMMTGHNLVIDGGQVRKFL